MRILRHASVAALLVLAAAPAASAQDATAKATARALATEGAEKFAAGDFAGALERFSKADQIVQAATLELFVARSHEKLGHLVEAQALYRKIVAEPVTKKTPAPIKQAIKDAQTELDALLTRVPQAQLAVKGPQAKDVKLKLDDAEVAAADLGAWLPMNPGAHKLHGEAEGFEPGDLDFELKEGERKPIPLELKAKEEPPPPPVVVEAPPPPPPPPPPPKAEPPPPPPEPKHGGGAQRTIGWLGMTFGTVGLLGGGVSGVMALVEKKNFTGSCDADKHCYASAQDSYDRSQMFAKYANIGLAAGGALWITGFVLVATAPKSYDTGKVTEPPRVVRVSPGLGSIAVQGTF